MSNIKAAERMGKLHDKLKSIGYDGHVLEVYLVRLLFCLFADDTSIFERRQFQDLIEQKTAEDGQDLAQWLGNLFQVLNTPQDKRLKKLDEHLAAFPYINGSLFAEQLPIAAFDSEMRGILLDCCSLDWSRISPAIFGALFQSVMDQKLRRNLGAHYTTEKNILKLIKPLFLDELRAEFEKLKGNRNKLDEFHSKLAKLKFLDPACGCGNFLVIAYRELRLLELDVLRAIHGKQQTLGVKDFAILCDVDQFYGIEIEEFPAQIAQTAMWLIDHQMNMMVSEELGSYFVRLPLKKSATIIHGNSLQLDWHDIVAPKDLDYIFGNPPFGGKKEQSKTQKGDMSRVFRNVKGAGVLDFVSAWYIKAADYMMDNSEIKTAYVSTNSITQGEQVGILWAEMLKRGVKIHFAHRTFQWSSEARGKAAVHCVIIGFALHDAIDKRIFDYQTVQSDPNEIKAKNINPYLIDADDLVLTKRRKPISINSPNIVFGSMPNDGGFLLLSTEEKDELINKYKKLEKWVKPILGSVEFINGNGGFCLWLIGISPDELRSMPMVLERVENVRRSRLDSSRITTKELAASSALFGEIRQPKGRYLAIPKTSSELRAYIPIAFLNSDIIANTELFTIDGADLYHFGVLTSKMHMAWVRSVCGRLKSDYRYSAGIVYNNFPWAQNATDKQRQAIEDAAQAVLDARAKYPNSTFADLYDPLAMPPDLVKAHQKLDAAVDASYSKKKFSGDSDRVAFLFELYQQIIAPLLAEKKKKRKLN
ncbi:Methyltransferase domain-containing protein [Methylomagnum ishizawai]|uniref:site-specific DNA-methyltransferase (adenine-specific) n=1 Tax=Methylomagnum ishizawai TaxID=1760988 RepID=A0A1Y6D4N2_9GAMM|nr:DNA methyltransferase [Methylomagnum ishizawai]SMF97908.1 Methyltransferase domain-containing protein [Methylomagnum ishizawai]